MNGYLYKNVNLKLKMYQAGLIDLVLLLTADSIYSNYSKLFIHN